MSDILPLPAARQDDETRVTDAPPDVTTPAGPPRRARVGPRLATPPVDPKAAAGAKSDDQDDQKELPDDLVIPRSNFDGVKATDDLPGFVDKFAAAWRQRTIETDMFSYAARMGRDMIDGYLADLSPKARARVDAARNQPGGYLASNADRSALWRKQFFKEVAAIRDLGPEGDPALADAPVSEEEFQKRLYVRRRAEHDEATQLLEIDGAGLGGFAGGMARDVVDPINLALVPLGVQGGLIRTFVAESVLGGVAAASSLPREYEVADDLDLPRPDALTRIGTEALFSGILGTIPGALVRGAKLYKTRRATRKDGKPAEMPAHVHEDAQTEAEARLRDELPDQPRRDAGQGEAGREQAAPPDFDFSATGNASPRTNRAGYVFGKLLEHGMEPHLAAGFVGNFMVESGAGLNPRARGDGGNAHGIAQWNDRRHALFAFANARGKDWTDLDVQVDFVMHELATTETGAWARIRRASTAAEAATLVSRYYERPGVPHLDRRVGHAKSVIDQYESGNVPKGGASAPSSFVPHTTKAGYTQSGQVRTAGDTRIDVEYQVVDASTLTRASGDLQPRDRSLGNSDEQVSNMAATLDPALLMPAPTADRGAPIIGPDNVIESGNGRFGAIARAAQQHPDRIDAYRQQIEAAGFTIPDDVRTPVLVGRRTSDLDADARRRFVVEAQDSGVARMTPVERSRAEAAVLDPATLARLDPTRALDDAANGDFLRAALDRMPRTERNAFVTPEGRLNADGRQALERALFARAFNDPDLLRRFTEQDAAELKALLDALFEASPAWARLVADVADGKVRPEFDITGHVIEAMRLIGAARQLAAAENLKLGNVLAELLDEVDLLEGAVSPLTRALVGKFWQNGRAAPKDRISDFLTRYANEARRVGSTETGLFGDGPDVTDVLRTVDADHFADLTELGTPRGQPSPAAPGPDVRDVLPEGSYAEGALSREAEEADALAEADLKGALGTSNSPKVLANRVRNSSAEDTPRPVSATSSASTTPQSSPGPRSASASPAAKSNTTAGRPSQSARNGDVIGNTSDTNISADAPAVNEASLDQARRDLLADGDFEVPLDGDTSISARALLDDIDDDMALDTVITTCTARGSNA